MEIFVYREGAEKVESGFTAEQLAELLKDEKAVIWIDMEAPTEGEAILQLEQAFVGSGVKIQDLLLEIVTHNAFRAVGAPK